MKKYKKKKIEKTLTALRISYLGGRITWWEYTKRRLSIYLKFY